MLEKIWNNAPESPWIYIFKDQNNKILYVWKAKNLKNRIKQYFQPWSVRKQDMLAKAHKLERITTSNNEEALILEENFIKQHQPEYNRLLKNNSWYVYIKIPNEDFPKISIVRKKLSDNANYIWPKNHSKNLKKFLNYLQNFFKLRTCSNSQFKKWKLCTKYDFGLCAWRCVNKNKQEYQKKISDLANFFEWNYQKIQNLLLEEIEKAIKIQNFERANQLKHFYLDLENFANKQNIVLNKEISWIIGKIIKIKTDSNNNQNNNSKSEIFVFSIIKLLNWKIIDIIRWKEFAQDIDLSTLIQHINQEFQINININDYDKQQDFWFENLNTKLNPEEKEELEKLINNSIQNFIISTSFEEHNIIWELLKNLQKKYNLKNFPYRIECVDISHMQWNYISAWLSCFVAWIKYNKWYRKYKITNTKNDDYLALEEVITRRFKNLKNLPDLFIIDWWKWQLNIIKKLITKNQLFKDLIDKIDFISIGKWKARKKNKINLSDKDTVEKIYFFDNLLNIKEQTLEYDQSDKILIELRDEAHRFANFYRKQQMESQWK